MAFDPQVHAIDPQSGLMIGKDSGHLIGIEQAPPLSLEPVGFVLGPIDGGTGGEDGTYVNVLLTGDLGSAVIANVTVNGGVVTGIVPVGGAAKYIRGDVLSAKPELIGGVAKFSIPIAPEKPVPGVGVAPLAVRGTAVQYPKWVTPHDSQIVRRKVDGAPDHVSTPGYPDFHVARDGGVTVLVKDADDEKLALGEYVAPKNPGDEGKAAFVEPRPEPELVGGFNKPVKEEV